MSNKTTVSGLLLVVRLLLCLRFSQKIIQSTIKASDDYNWLINCGAWWRIGRFDAFRPEGHWFESGSSRRVGTLDKSLTRSCLWRFGVKFRIRAVSGALLSIADLKRRHRNSVNERMNE